MSISVTVSGEDSTSVVSTQALSDTVTIADSVAVQVTTTNGDAATVTVSIGDPVTITGNFSNFVTGSVVRPNEISSFITSSDLSDLETATGNLNTRVNSNDSDINSLNTATGALSTATGLLVPKLETGSFLTSGQIDTNISTAVSNLVDSAPSALDTLNKLAAALNDNENFGSETIVSISNLNTATGLLVQKSETGVFYTNDNPSGFITGVDLSDLQSATGDLNIRVNENESDISALQIATGLLVQKSQTGNFITDSDTGAFYATSNPSGFITGVDLSDLNTATGVLSSATGVLKSDIVSNDNDISALQTATGLLVQKSETGNFIIDSDTGAFYATSNPSGFITGVDLSSYVQNSETGLFLVSGEDAVVNTLGIGTSTPSQKLHVAGGKALVEQTSSAGSVIVNRTDGKSTALVAAGAESALLYDSAGFFSIQARSSSNVLAGNGDVNDEVIRIDSAGDVGIGTDDPSEKLEVNGNILSNGVIKAINPSQNVAQLEVGRGGTQYIEMRVSDPDCFIIANQDSDSNGTHHFVLDRIFGGTGADDFVISKGGAEQVTVNTDGNVGIGTTSPQANLHVSGDTILSGDATVGKITLSENSFVTETGNFTLESTHRGATVLLQNTSPITVTVPSLAAGHVTTFIAETINDVSFATGVGISGLNSFNGANSMLGQFAQAQIIFKTSEYAFLGGQIT